jgi:hypothetical protein
MLAQLARRAAAAAHTGVMSTDTSIGPAGDRGGNDSAGNAAGCGNKTLGEQAVQQRPAGAGVLEQAAPEVPAGIPGGQPKPGIAKGPASYPDGPNVEASPWELDAARGKPPPER